MLPSQQVARARLIHPNHGLLPARHHLTTTPLVPRHPAPGTGVYNGTAPKPVTMAQLCSELGSVMGRPSWLPVPDFALNTLLLEGAQVCACLF